MTDHDTKQDHPGAEWHEAAPAIFYHAGLKETVCGNPQVRFHEGEEVWICATRAEAIERCRAISAAALHWERLKEMERVNARDGDAPLGSWDRPLTIQERT